MQQFQDPPEKGGQAMHTSRYAELPYLQYERRETVLMAGADIGAMEPACSCTGHLSFQCECSAAVVW